MKEYYLKSNKKTKKMMMGFDGVWWVKKKNLKNLNEIMWKTEKKKQDKYNFHKKSKNKNDDACYVNCQMCVYICERCTLLG